MYLVKKCYSRYVKNAKRKYKQDIINRLQDLSTKQPKEYWKLLDSLNQDEIIL